MKGETMNTSYNWNQIVKSEETGYLSPLGHKEIKVTIAVGTSGCGWSTEEARLSAEDTWHNEEKNPFVIRNGTPRHVELCGLTEAEVLERVPDATV